MFYMYETDISNPIPSQAHHYPTLIVQAPTQPYPGVQLMLWKRIERPPKYMQIAHITDQGGEGGLEGPALSD